MKREVVLLSCLLALTACKNGRTAEPAGEDMQAETVVEETVEEEEAEEPEEGEEELISETPMPLAADELFDDFIFNFSANRKLQQERIAFPLRVNSGTKTDSIERRQWQMEHFFMRQGYYTLLFDSEDQLESVKDTALSQAIVEKIFLDQLFVRQYLFSRQSGRWMLQEVRNQTIDKNPNASFLKFYQKFATDSTFQMHSLSEQITFVGPDPDDDFSQMEGVITPDSWSVFAPELPQTMLYNIVYGRQDPDARGKIFVLRGISNGLELEMFFARVGERWLLTKLIM